MVILDQQEQYPFTPIIGECRMFCATKHQLDAFKCLNTALFVAFFCIAPSIQANQPTPTTPVTISHKIGDVVIAQLGDQLLWQFNYSADLSKPFFHPVSLPNGKTLTWNSPPDHRWHHGLWFSWKFIDGVNYWEPNSQTGKPDGRTKWQNVTVTTSDSGAACIKMELCYIAPNDTPVLTELRTITVSAPDNDGSYFFDWTSDFTGGKQEAVLDRTPLPNEPGGEVYGGYAGLSVRFAKELTDREAITDNGPVEYSPQSRFRGKARVMEYNGEIGGQAVGVAICDHPKNLNHPTPWYAIRSDVMSYYSPAVICYAPHTVSPGERFLLRYRVVIHSDRWDSPRLQSEFARFVEDFE
jgi:hypothetical protein